MNSNISIGFRRVLFSRSGKHSHVLRAVCNLNDGMGSQKQKKICQPIFFALCTKPALSPKVAFGLRCERFSLQSSWNDVTQNEENPSLCFCFCFGFSVRIIDEKS
jgi:hypothetical protein